MKSQLWIALVIVFTVCTSGEAAKKNVLFIAIDDLRPELGCFGSDVAISPHLDALAAKSVVFKNHFVQVPTCGASRYALLTGRSPAKSGVTSQNAAAYRGKSAFSMEQLPGAQTLPELFQRSGYHTTLIGKISHTADGLVYEYNGEGDGRHELPHAWDELATPLGPWKRGWGIFFAYADGKHREDGGGHIDLMQFTVENDDDLPDGMLATTAEEKLREFSKSDKPFFLGLGFIKPHLPFVAPKQDWEAFEGVQISDPPHPEKPDSPHWHKSGEFFKYTFPFPKERPLSPEEIRECRRAYLACVRYTDRQVGRVMKVLEETGLAESTVVVVWGDHGWNLGDSDMWAKHTPFERAVHSPLIIFDPAHTNNARTTDALVETIDIYPTLIDLCEPSFTKMTHPLDGKSLLPILNNTKPSVRNNAVSYWRDSVTVRTATHRLIATKKKGSNRKFELYDQTTDFDPVKNLAESQPEVVKKLTRLLP
ncbi:sulfatase [Thalassoglobus polymorphus]|uniref:Choline-sulfatase n=1 Tax=Thalassoglobus polymorphus TaxID=2527994 RepID=A0A517QHX8_9PLAN|nr:sulfatase [Thalassoglobus polymorphus]QDT31241.1 Choline-sulfatase [Thalassoglobus polymorphus]